MSLKYKKSLAITGLCAVMLPACASVTDQIPTVKVVRKAKKAKVIKAAYTPEVPAIQRAEAPVVCENENMRRRAADRNSKNDEARILILDEGGRNNTVIGDVLVNCRDYFAAKSAPAVPRKLPAFVTTTPQPDNTQVSQSYYQQTNAPQRAVTQAAQTAYQYRTTPNSAQSGLFHAVRKGDTLYSIARNNCTDVETVARLNGISDPRLIDIGQIIKLPAQSCNSRR